MTARNTKLLPIFPTLRVVPSVEKCGRIVPQIGAKPPHCGHLTNVPSWPVLAGMSGQRWGSPPVPSPLLQDACNQHTELRIKIASQLLRVGEDPTALHYSNCIALNYY